MSEHTIIQSLILISKELKIDLKEISGREEW